MPRNDGDARVRPRYDTIAGSICRIMAASCGMENLVDTPWERVGRVFGLVDSGGPNDLRPI
jgi:hypothetical protein